jgi:hypothetical protein
MEKNINEKELEEKLKRVKEKSSNPTAKEYGNRLAELLDAKASGRNDFVNWITGLATGSMFLAFSGTSSAAAEYQCLLLSSGVASLLCIISALAFKMLLEVRFSAMELEVSMLKNIWEGHDIKTELAQLAQSGREVTEEQKQRLLRNLDESLNYLDESYLEKLKKPINIKSKLWEWSYWITLVLFLLALSLMATYHVRVVL